MSIFILTNLPNNCPKAFQVRFLILKLFQTKVNVVDLFGAF